MAAGTTARGGVEVCNNCLRSLAPVDLQPSSSAASWSGQTRTRAGKPVGSGGVRTGTSRLADNVHTLGGIVVGVAWGLGIISVVAAVLLYVTDASAASLVMALIVGVGGVVNAMVLALFGLYAQMRASELLERR